MAQPILTREKDGLRFEPTVQPGMVRCEACLELVEPSAIKEHICVEWWKPEYQYQPGWLTEPCEECEKRAPNKVFRNGRK